MAQTLKEKIPPHDDEFERAALGSILEDQDALSAAVELNLKSEDFYSRANQKIYKAILSLDEKSIRADILSVVQELKQLGTLDESGGASYVSSLTTVIPSGANIEYYVQMIKDFSLKRSLLKVSSDIGVYVYDESKGASEALESVQQDIFKLSDDRHVATSQVIGDVIKKTVELIDKSRQSKTAITGIPSGFEKLDELTTGFQPEEFIIIAARPGVGKTAIALNMAAHISFHKNIAIAFFSLEMSSAILVQRLISSEAAVNAQKIRNGKLETAEYRQIINTMGKIYKAPFYMVDMPNMKLSNLRSQARKVTTQQKVEAIFIDYLGLIGYENEKMERYNKFSEISRSLKSLARELHIPVIVLCQLNREAQWEEPTLANLRDSGSIEQDADLVIFLHPELSKKKKTDKIEEKVPPSGMILTNLIIAKQRNGPTGFIKLAFNTKVAKFIEINKEQEESIRNEKKPE